MLTYHLSRFLQLPNGEEVRECLTIASSEPRRGQEVGGIGISQCSPTVLLVLASYL